MGWSIGWNSKAELVDYLLKGCTQGDMKLLDKAMVGGTLYALCQRGEHRFIGVFLIKGYRERGGTEWGYKGMDESMGPCEATCPERLLAQSNDMSGYAVEWRARCRAARKAKGGGKKFAESLRIGDEFVWGEARVIFSGFVLHRGKRILTGTNAATGELHRYPVAQIRPAP